MKLGIEQFADSAIVIAMRVWVPTINLYAAKYQAYCAIYLTLKEAEITIPFPQHDINLHQVKP